MSNYTTPDWLDTGDNAWQLTAGSLVGLQSVPGLVVIYAGIVKRKWAINSAFMAFYAYAAVMICWVLWAYKMAFGKQLLPFVGVPGPLVTVENEIAQAILPASGVSANFPMSTMCYFQFVFAAITVVIIAGSFLGRMNFIAWMFFVPLWLTLSYTVGAFSLWGGGFLQVMGVIDYSGGYVIHVSSGTAGFVGAWWIGPRMAWDREVFRPNNILVMLVGAGILWVGWNGFNGGDPYAASADAGAAVLNTNVATSMSLLVWTILDIIVFGKPAVIGAVKGMISGLVAITPGAGVVDGWGAIVIGILAGTIPWVSMNIVGRWRPFTYVDDTLSVFHAHAVAGIVGGMAVGVLATEEGCAAFGLTNPGGAIAGNWKQVWLQLVGALFIMFLNILMTSVVMLFIKYVLRIRLRMSEEMLLIGDDAVHGEDAYTFKETHELDMELGIIPDHLNHRVSGNLSHRASGVRRELKYGILPSFPGFI
jgi:Amt family ammonium transporter